MLKPWLITATLIFIFDNYEAAMMSAPVGKIKSLSLSDCGPNQKTSLYNINEEGEKAVDASLELKEDLDGTKARFTLDVAKWEGNTWREDIYNKGGKLCEYIKEYIPEIWKKLQTIISKPFTGDDWCMAEKGTYEIKKFQAFSEDVKIPSVFYGKFKLTFKVLKPDRDEIILCTIYQMESTQ